MTRIRSQCYKSKCELAAVLKNESSNEMYRKIFEKLDIPLYACDEYVTVLGHLLYMYDTEVQDSHFALYCTLQKQS